MLDHPAILFKFDCCDDLKAGEGSGRLLHLEVPPVAKEGDVHIHLPSKPISATLDGRTIRHESGKL